MRPTVRRRQDHPVAPLEALSKTRSEKGRPACPVRGGLPRRPWRLRARLWHATPESWNSPAWPAMKPGVVRAPQPAWARLRQYDRRAPRRGQNRPDKGRQASQEQLVAQSTAIFILQGGSTRRQSCGLPAESMLNRPRPASRHTAPLRSSNPPPGNGGTFGQIQRIRIPAIPLFGKSYSTRTVMTSVLWYCRWRTDDA